MVWKDFKHNMKPAYEYTFLKMYIFKDFSFSLYGRSDLSLTPVPFGTEPVSWD